MAEKVGEKTKEKVSKGDVVKTMDFYAPNYMTQMLSGSCTLPEDEDNGRRGKCDKSPSGAHWWLIESAGKPSSRGRCRYCGEPRVFWNTVEGALKAGVMVIRRVNHKAEKDNR